MASAVNIIFSNVFGFLIVASYILCYFETHPVNLAGNPIAIFSLIWGYVEVPNI